MERQYRARASAAADLETKLRAELEETVIQNEKLTKQHSELKIKYGRLERQSKEQQDEFEQSRKNLEERTAKVAQLEEKIRNMEIEGEKKKEEWAEVERLANEGVSKVRSEMSQAVLESEERYRSQLETMEEELRIERDKRNQLEQQVDNLLENAAVMVPSLSNEYAKETKEVSLRESEGQAQILEGLGLGGKDEEGDEGENEDENEEQEESEFNRRASGSYAALEQLTSNLKIAKRELEALRTRLAESERIKESLLEDLGECREAKEKLPLFEAKVKDLTAENREKELEIRGLQDDIADVKEMYRAQLNILLEEKAAAWSVSEADKQKEMNGSNDPGEDEQEDAGDQTPAAENEPP